MRNFDWGARNKDNTFSSTNDVIAQSNKIEMSAFKAMRALEGVHNLEKIRVESEAEGRP